MNFEQDENKEVWRHLPDVFVDRYSSLVSMAFPGLGMGSSQRQIIGRADVPGHKSRLSSGGVDIVAAAGAAHGKNAAASVTSVVGSERALGYKAVIDRRLRKVGREISTWMRDDKAGVRKCGGRCKQYAEPDWLYCPSCGAPTEQVR